MACFESVVTSLLKEHGYNRIARWFKKARKTVSRKEAVIISLLREHGYMGKAKRFEKRCKRP